MVFESSSAYFFVLFGIDCSFSFCWKGLKKENRKLRYGLFFALNDRVKVRSTQG